MLRIKFHLCNGALKPKWNTHSIAKAGDLPKVHELAPSRKGKKYLHQNRYEMTSTPSLFLHMSWKFFYLNQKVLIEVLKAQQTNPCFWIYQTICLSHSSLK
jgi:hypothetical protein